MVTQHLHPGEILESAGTVPAGKGARPVQDCTRLGSDLRVQPREKNTVELGNQLLLHLQWAPERGEGLWAKCPEGEEHTALCVTQEFHVGMAPAPRVVSLLSPSAQTQPVLLILQQTDGLGISSPAIFHRDGTIPVPELWQFQPDVSDPLCNTCPAWLAPAFSLGGEIWVSPPLPLKTTSLGFPES